MKLRDVLVLEKDAKPRNWYDKLVLTLDTEDREWLDACLANPEFSSTYIAKKLREFGFQIGESAVLRIRKERF